MSYMRYPNGVRERADGLGDSWANMHRELPRNLYMTDFDAMLGMIAFGQNGGDTLFAEYALDKFANSGKLIRSFGLVAIMERKRTPFAARSHGSPHAVGFHLHTCRLYAEKQPVKPRFFFVFGETEPFTMQELDIATGEEIGVPVVLPHAATGWVDVWRALGLMQAHQQLTQWLALRT